MVAAYASRGKGFGFANLWSAALNRAGARRVIGLDGVVAQEGNYQRSGFVTVHRNMRYRGVVPEEVTDASPPPEHASSQASSADTPLLSSSIRPVTATQVALVEAIVEYDAALFPAPRAPFVRAWLSSPGHMTLVALSQSFERKVLGYVVTRPTRSGAYKIGPLFADSYTVARALLAQTLQALPIGGFVFLDVPAANTAACQLAAAHGWEKTFETLRMYRGEICSIDTTDRVWGITTFELG